MIADAPKNIQEILKRLPQKPGVYQYFDEKGDIIYVGKAKKLKNRVTSYFTKDKYENGKTRLLVSKIRNLEFIVVETEFDALLLENSLIKKHQPRYNIQLRDDKTYPWICIKKERFPRLFPTRTLVKDGSEYYGPYASVKTMKTVLNLVRHLYKFRTCKYNLSKENIKAQKFRVCLEYHIGNCKAPCVANQSEQNYNEAIDNARRIIKGDIGEVIKHMKQLMQEYAHEMRFELAEDAKTQIEALEKYQAKSTVVNPSINNVDVFSIITDEEYGYVNYLQISYGSIIRSHTLEVKKKLSETAIEILQLAVIELRNRFQSHCKEIYVPFKINAGDDIKTMQHYQNYIWEKFELVFQSFDQKISGISKYLNISCKSMEFQCKETQLYSFLGNKRNMTNKRSMLSGNINVNARTKDIHCEKDITYTTIHVPNQQENDAFIVFEFQLNICISLKIQVLQNSYSAQTKVEGFYLDTWKWDLSGSYAYSIEERITRDFIYFENMIKIEIRIDFNFMLNR